MNLGTSGTGRVGLARSGQSIRVSLAKQAPDDRYYLKEENYAL